MTVRILAAFILSILPALPQVSPSWRFWRAQDGLPGTYTFGVSVAQGDVWGVHGGSPPLLSVNDGYTVRSIAPAHPKSRILAAGRHIWSVSREGVHHLESNVWKRHVIPEFQSNAEASRETGEVALPKTSGEILLLTRKKLWLYEPTTGRTVEIGSSSAHPLGDFNHLIGALDGGVWVSADYGVAKVTAISSPRPRWQTYRTTLPGLRGFRSPHEEAETGLTVTANIVGSPEKAVVQFDGKQWRILDRSTHNTLRGWFAPSNVLWLQRDNSLTMKWGSTEIPVERTDALSGSYNQVVHESPSAFWMATSQGIIRHSQPLWASPAPDAPDEIVNSIAEDRKGRIWFSGDNSLVCLDGSTWRRYRTVGDAGIKVLRTGGLMAAADGKIIFHSSRRSLEALDPETGGTSQVIHPLGRLIHAADRKADGTFQIVSRSSPAGAYFLESFDGHKFTEEQKLGSIPDPYDDIRTVLRASDGSVWLGGSGLPLVRRNETNQLLTAKDGFPASGFHTIFEAERGRILIGDLDVLAAYDGKGWSVLQSGIDRVRRMIRSKDGTLWAASGMGIHRLKNGVWITNDSADGLKSSIANTVFEDSKGRIWAGTARGLFVYNAAADQDAPRTFIPSTGNLRETPTSGDTTLAFSGTDKWKYTDASRLLFSYRLDGGSWSPYRPGSTASFRSLAPGDHRFEVKAMDRNGSPRDRLVPMAKRPCRDCAHPGPFGRGLLAA